MKQHKNLNAKLNILKEDVSSKTLLVGLAGFNFSNRIAGKYTFFRKSGRLPALIFLKLFGRRVMNKITNNDYMKSINNYFRLHLNFYLKMVRQLDQVLSYRYQSQKLYYSANSSGTNFQAEKISNFVKDAFHFPKNIATNFSLRKIDNFILSFLNDIKWLLRPLVTGETLTSLRLTKGHENLNTSPQSSSLWGEGKGEGGFSYEKYNASYVNQDKRMLSRLQPLSQNIQNLQNITAIEKIRHLLTSSLMFYNDNTIPVTVKFFQIPPHPPLLKGGILDSPFGKGGLRGIFYGISKSPSVSRPQKAMLTNNFMRVRTEHGVQGGVYKTAMANSPAQHIAYSPLRSTGNGLWSAVGGQRTVIRHAPYAISHMSSDNLYFHNQRKIEQEVEEIKKVVVETKETIKETNNHSPKDVSMEIKKHLDINRISDQVYQNIERRIRMERERRGL